MFKRSVVGLFLILVSGCGTSKHQIIALENGNINIRDNRRIDIQCDTDNNSSDFHFNGRNQYVNLDTLSLEVGNGLTLSLMMKTKSKEFQWIVGKYDWSTDAGYHLVLIDGIARFNGRDKGGEYVRCKGRTFIADGKPHHLVCVWKDNTWSLWVDGELENQVETETLRPGIKSIQPLELGRSIIGHKGSHYYFEGFLDQIKFYNKALSDRQIKRLLN
ncbi:LamG domain-containing protein [Flagellimonas sp. S3867]|uniref:LamG domain-containing protein n=1 Tax=Flagellimonas sp. S3867 TaxID=2768063 RepID=UPI00168A322C|nr:LamG domain-containing protein [Flagellimonas sp. S3867]